VITTVAGTGVTGYSGDGGPATAARLREVRDVAVDAAGNIYIADEQNHRIRRVSTSGVMTTFAGTGSSGFSGDGGAPGAARVAGPRGVSVTPSGNVLIADTGNHRIRRVT
jgi:glucose/arabinose dehydrogenase